jgi:hypothetical protein
MAEKKPRPKTPKRQTSPFGWLSNLQKPRMTIHRGESARAAQEDHASRPVTIWTVIIRLAPVWALLIMILILEPTLPLRAVGAVANGLIGLLPRRATPTPAEPVFIIEAPESGSVASELPAPNWPLDIAPIFTPEVQHWEERIAQWSVAYRIKPNMIATLMQIESCGNPQAVSPAGAVGLFQVLPIHFQAGEDGFNPDTNAGRGLIYLGQQLASVNGDPGLAFAAYNGGPSVITSSPAEWAQETQDYQFWASGIYEEAEMGLVESPTLLAWLDAGGASLCTQAAQVLSQTAPQP